MSYTEPRSGLDLVHTWGLGVNNWSSDMDSNLKRLGFFGIHTSALDRDVATPPGAPSNGDAYIVAANPTDSWVGHTDHIAVWDGSLANPAWAFCTPKEGWTCFVLDEAIMLTYKAGVWSYETNSYFLHTQISPSDLWIINHNTGRRVIVSVFDSGNSVIDAEITNPSINQTRVSLTIASAGSAVIR